MSIVGFQNHSSDLQAKLTTETETKNSIFSEIYKTGIKWSTPGWFIVSPILLFYDIHCYFSS